MSHWQQWSLTYVWILGSRAFRFFFLNIYFVLNEGVAVCQTVNLFPSEQSTPKIWSHNASVNQQPLFFFTLVFHPSDSYWSLSSSFIDHDWCEPKLLQENESAQYLLWLQLIIPSRRPPLALHPPTEQQLKSTVITEHYSPQTKGCLKQIWYEFLSNKPRSTQTINILRNVVIHFSLWSDILKLCWSQHC